MNLSQAELKALSNVLPTLPRKEKEEVLILLEEASKRMAVKSAKNDLLQFARAVYPGYEIGQHHRWMARLFRQVIDGTKKRIIINIAPRMGKSELSSYLLPAWFLGQRPDAKIMMATHTADLSEDFGRRIRNLISDPDYHAIFPNTRIAHDSKGAGKWSTDQGGTYYAAGVGGSIAGRGADLLIIDDPHSEQSVKANPKLTFDQAWTWYQQGPRQRLQWGAAIILVMCMTGDTRVRLASGREKPLREIRPMDEVATYDDGRLSTARVLNWQSSGVDSIFTIRTQSGRIIRANERHPFLVADGEPRWVRLRDLRPGMCLVATKGAIARPDRRENRGCAIRVKQLRRTIKSTLMRLIARLAITGSGQAKPAGMTGVQPPPLPMGSVVSITRKRVGRLATVLRLTKIVQPVVLRVSSTVTGSLRKISISFFRVRMAAVQCAENLLQKPTLARTGVASCASITSMKLGVFGDCSATTVTSRLGTQRLPQRQTPWLDTSDFTTDRIVEILPDGQEEVFDVEIERTGNFIANGVVSHNTRWGKNDLTGRLLDHAAKNPDADQWEVVEFPAILPSGNALWPAKWPVEVLNQTRASIDPRYWSAQYMQKPTADEGAIVKREWWRVWENPEPPKCSYVIQSWDTAFEAKTSADYSAYTLWGVFDRKDEDGVYKPNVILLDAFKDRMEFPELKSVALKHYSERRPDTCIVERKASGASLIQEMRAVGVPVTEFTPSRGRAGVATDKTARLNAVSDMFASGMVWVPDTRWGKEVMDEVASFPHGDHDDYVDSTVMALQRIRNGGLVRLPTDEDVSFKQRRSIRYY